MLDGYSVENYAQLLALLCLFGRRIIRVIVGINHVIGTFGLIVEQVAGKNGERVELPRFNDIVQVAVDKIRRCILLLVAFGENIGHLAIGNKRASRLAREVFIDKSLACAVEFLTRKSAIERRVDRNRERTHTHIVVELGRSGGTCQHWYVGSLSQEYLEVGVVSSLSACTHLADVLQSVAERVERSVERASHILLLNVCRHLVAAVERHKQSGEEIVGSSQVYCKRTHGELVLQVADSKFNRAHIVGCHVEALLPHVEHSSVVRSSVYKLRERTRNIRVARTEIACILGCHRDVGVVRLDLESLDEAIVEGIFATCDSIRSIYRTVELGVLKVPVGNATQVLVGCGKVAPHHAVGCHKRSFFKEYASTCILSRVADDCCRHDIGTVVGCTVFSIAVVNIHTSTHTSLVFVNHSAAHDGSRHKIQTSATNRLVVRNDTVAHMSVLRHDGSTTKSLVSVVSDCLAADDETSVDSGTAAHRFLAPLLQIAGWP